MSLLLVGKEPGIKKQSKEARFDLEILETELRNARLFQKFIGRENLLEIFAVNYLV